MIGPFDFARTVGAWRERIRFRSQLSRLLETPHLAADLGFDLSAVRAEHARLPWQPVRLRRGAPVRDGASASVAGARRAGPAAVSPAAAERI